MRKRLSAAAFWLYFAVLFCITVFRSSGCISLQIIVET